MRRDNRKHQSKRSDWHENEKANIWRIKNEWRYIDRRKREDAEFSETFDAGYENFKIGVLLKRARLDAGMTREQIAKKTGTQKTAILRMENHAEDIRLSTIGNYAKAIGKTFTVKIA